MLKIALLSVIVAAAVGQNLNFNGGDSSWYCDIFKDEDCSTHNVDERCGTDGITYRNMCALGKAHCADPTVNQRQTGACMVASVTSTLSPEQIVHGSQIVLDFQCIRLSHQTCTHTINEKICATDGVTYADFCEYEKARCTHRDLHVVKLGDCSA